jgi:hypothetical protein
MTAPELIKLERLTAALDRAERRANDRPSLYAASNYTRAALRLRQFLSTLAPTASTDAAPGNSYNVWQQSKIGRSPNPSYLTEQVSGVGIQGPKGDPSTVPGPAGQKGDSVTGPQGPIGLTGKDGKAATVTVGTTATLAPGSQAIVTATGIPNALALNFGIPAGMVGKQGPIGMTGQQGWKGDPGSTGRIGTKGIQSWGPREIRVTRQPFPVFRARR